MFLFNAKALYQGIASYEGEWINGNREGKGKLTFSDGSYYEGGFLNKFHGEGTYLNFITTSYLACESGNYA